MKHHILKTDPLPFDAVWRGDKTHEIRFNDRDYQTGDTLGLIEMSKADGAPMSRDSAAATGRTITANVTHVQTGYGLCEGWVILSIAKLLKFNNSESEV